MLIRFGEQFVFGLMRNPTVQGVEDALVSAVLLTLTAVFKGGFSFSAENKKLAADSGLVA